MGTKKYPEIERMEPEKQARVASQYGGPLSELEDMRHCALCGRDIWSIKAVDGMITCPCGAHWFNE